VEIWGRGGRFGSPAPSESTASAVLPGAEGEGDSLGEAGDSEELLEPPLFSRHILLRRGVGAGIKTSKGPKGPSQPIPAWVPRGRAQANNSLETSALG
jgi:hypothetical protein